MTATVHTGDALAILRALPESSVNCCVTSPPYWGLRDYGVDGQIGLEQTLPEFLARLVAVFDEVRRVLRDDGVCWVNMGDSYAGGRGDTKTGLNIRTGQGVALGKQGDVGGKAPAPKIPFGVKPKDLIGQPWRLAFALQDAGWWLRSDCIWHKPNPMPESVTDRPTKAHEYVFLLTKSPRYAYDADAVKTPVLPKTLTVRTTPRKGTGIESRGEKVNAWMEANGGRKNPTHANLRTVWAISSRPFKGAHFATFPEALAERCILAGCPVGGTVLDPFTGSGTTGVVALRNGRSFVGCELNPEYANMARTRITAEAPLFVQAVGVAQTRRETPA